MKRYILALILVSYAAWIITMPAKAQPEQRVQPLQIVVSQGADGISIEVHHSDPVVVHLRDNVNVNVRVIRPAAAAVDPVEAQKLEALKKAFPEKK